MADQNPQANQNLDNRNDNDELFWWSDDIFENSDLLQPISSEIDSAHEVVKSQNDLNNFNEEIQWNAQENISDNLNNDWEEHGNITNDDLFEQSQTEQNSWDEHFANLYDETWEKEEESNHDELWANDDIFESQEVKEEPKEEPEIVEQIDEPENEETVDEPLVDEQPVEKQAEEDEEKNLEGPEENSDEWKNEEKLDDEGLDDFDDFDDVDDIDDEDEEYDELEENTEWVAQIKKTNEEKDEEEEEADEEENVDERTDADDSEEEEEDETFDDIDDEETKEETPQTDEEEKENITVQDYEKYDPNLFKTDLQKKFGELQWKTEKIHELVWKEQDVWFDLLWWNDDRQKTIYKILSGSDYVEIEKEELNKEDESTIVNTLEFMLEEYGLSIIVNETVLYYEIPDLQNDPNKKMQVLEKMNKFIFLLDEEYKKIQKYKKEKAERNAVKWVFRNF